MGAASALIVSVSTPGYGQVVVDASDGRRYHADLSALAAVYCFPRTAEEWEQVAPDADRLALVWTTRFEVHIDQIQGLAHQVEERRESA